MNKAAYATIGHRLSTSLLSPTAYGSPGGWADIQSAQHQFLYEDPLSYGFSFIPTLAKDLDFLDGPNIVAGFSDYQEERFDNSLFAFIYDDLNLILNGQNYYKAYQARVIFEKQLEPDDFEITCHTLKHTLNLMLLKANLHTLVHEESTSIALGLHHDAIHRIPEVAETMLECGFRESGTLKNEKVQLYCTSFQPIL